MAKNYASIYNSVNDSSALNQNFYLKEESTRGVFSAPSGSDFLFTQSGGSVNFTQPFESSPHRSGRHNNNIIKQKTETSWTLPTFFNINESGAADGTQIDAAVKLLYKSMFGREQNAASTPTYDSALDPSYSFTIIEAGDMWSKQAVGAVVESVNLAYPGDGQANSEWSGRAKTSLTVGIGKSTVDNNTGNTVTVQVGEGKRFPVGAKVMLIESDGITRSADTPDGSPRTVTAVSGDVITLDGAALADADGSVNPIYLVYYEPASPSGIDNPVTGLEGSISVAGVSASNCVRSLTLNCVNNHEYIDYCFGEDGLAGSLYAPGGRLEVSVTIELNMNKELVGFLNDLRQFSGAAVTLILGDSTKRHQKVTLPKVIFNVPEVSVPDTGSIPVSFEGTAVQTALDAADEIKVEFL